MTIDEADDRYTVQRTSPRTTRHAWPEWNYRPLHHPRLNGRHRTGKLGHKIKGLVDSVTVFSIISLLGQVSCLFYQSVGLSVSLPVGNDRVLCKKADSIEIPFGVVARGFHIETKSQSTSEASNHGSITFIRNRSQPAALRIVCTAR